MKNFSDRLDSMRKGMTQKEFANKIGVPLNTYTAWLRGERLPSFEAIINICTVLDVKSDWLLTGKEGSSIPITSTLRDKIQRGLGATGKNSHELATLLGVSPGEVQAALDGTDQSQAFSQAFETHVQPIIDMRKKGVCPNCTKEIDRLNKIIDKLIQK
jgi:transcriptional regulator with XRE-family HTH domain